MSQASIRKKKEGPQEPFVVVPHKLAIRPWVTAGKLTGASGDRVDVNNHGASNKMLMGGGLSVRHYFTETTGAGLNFDVLWKDLPEVDDTGPFRAVTYYGSLLFDPYPRYRTANSFRFDFGFTNLKCLNYDSATVNLNTHFFLGIGIEFRTYTSCGTKATLTLWYREMFSKDHELKDFNNLKAPFNATYIGLELGVSFSLKKFPL
jgi:hypothetical protein